MDACADASAQHVLGTHRLQLMVRQADVRDAKFVGRLVHCPAHCHEIPARRRLDNDVGDVASEDEGQAVVDSCQAPQAYRVERLGL